MFLFALYAVALTAMYITVGMTRTFTDHQVAQRYIGVSRALHAAANVVLD